MIELDQAPDLRDRLDTAITLADHVELAHAISRSKGWWEAHPDVPVDLTPDEMLAKLMLITTEVSEAAECVRNGEALLWHGENNKPEGLLAELADVFIRICDTVGALGAGDAFSDAVYEKMEYNLGRSHRHGGKKA